MDLPMGYWRFFETFDRLVPSLTRGFITGTNPYGVTPNFGTSSPEATSVAIFVITVAEGWLTRPQPLRGLFFVGD